MITAKYEGKEVTVVKILNDFDNMQVWVDFNYKPKRYAATDLPDVSTILSDLTDINFNNTKE